MNRRKTILNGLEILILAGLAFFIILMLRSGSAGDVSAEQIREAFLSVPETEGLIQRGDTQVHSAFGLIPSEYIYYSTDDIMDVRMLFAAKAADDEELELIETAAGEYLETQIQNYTGYGTNQVDLLEHAVSFRKGSYYFLAVGEQAEALQEIFLRQIG